MKDRHSTADCSSLSLGYIDLCGVPAFTTHTDEATLTISPARLGNNSNKLEYLRYDIHDIVDFVDRE